jgi:hypothetical protein
MFLACISFPLFLLFLRNKWEIAFIVGALTLWWAVQTCREKLRVYRTRSWPTATGTVTNIRSRKVDGGINGIDYYKVAFDFNYRVAQDNTGTYEFNCTSEAMADGAVAGMQNKTVSVHYKPSDEAKGILWEDEIWDIWWDTYWAMTHPDAQAAPQ